MIIYLYLIVAARHVVSADLPVRHTSQAAGTLSQHANNGQTELKACVDYNITCWGVGMEQS